LLRERCEVEEQEKGQNGDEEVIGEDTKLQCIYVKPLCVRVSLLWWSKSNILLDPTASVGEGQRQQQT